MYLLLALVAIPRARLYLRVTIAMARRQTLLLTLSLPWYAKYTRPDLL